MSRYNHKVGLQRRCMHPKHLRCYILEHADNVSDSGGEKKDYLHKTIFGHWEDPIISIRPQEVDNFLSRLKWIDWGHSVVLGKPQAIDIFDIQQQ